MREEKTLTKKKKKEGRVNGEERWRECTGRWSPPRGPVLLRRSLQLSLSAAQDDVPLCDILQWDVEREMCD